MRLVSLLAEGGGAVREALQLARWLVLDEADKLMTDKFLSQTDEILGEAAARPARPCRATARA